MNNTKIKDFIVKSCELNEAKRLSQYELETFDFGFNYGNVSQLASEIFTHSCSYRVNEESSPIQNFISSNNTIILSSLNRNHNAVDKNILQLFRPFLLVSCFVQPLSSLNH